jgi:hypothetical protein
VKRTLDVHDQTFTNDHEKSRSSVHCVDARSGNEGQADISARRTGPEITGRASFREEGSREEGCARQGRRARRTTGTAAPGADV